MLVASVHQLGAVLVVARMEMEPMSRLEALELAD
jgi:hypothetical protein